MLCPSMDVGWGSENLAPPVSIWGLAPGVGSPPEDERDNDAENGAPEEEQSGRRNSDESNHDHNERNHQPRDSTADRNLADVDLWAHTASLIYCHYAPKVGISENDLRISASPKLTFDTNEPGISASGFARDLTSVSIAARRRW